MKIHVIAHNGHFEKIAQFLHIRQAVAALPALARTAGCSVFLYSEEPLGLTAADLPRGCRFDFSWRSKSDMEGTEGVFCTP